MASPDIAAAEQQLASTKAAHRNDPDRVIGNLQTRLASDAQQVAGSFQTGGVVPKDAAYKLHAGEQVLPAQTDLTQPQQDAQNPPEQDADSTNLPDDENAVAGEGVTLQRAYSKLNSAVTALFDGLGVRRSATVAHVAGESMSDHIDAVSKVLPTIGGVTANLSTATHTKHDPNGGATVLHPADKLRSTIVPKDNDLAKAAINACRSFVNKVESLVDETPEVKMAKSQLALISKQDGAGMSSFDLGAALLSVPGPLIQLVARLHSTRKHGAHHAQ